jgi:hemerythrin superfamily protein
MKANNHWVKGSSWGLFIAALLFTAGISNSCNTAVNSAGSASKNQVLSNIVKGDEKLKMEIPASIAAEHKELHETLDNVIRSGGKTGNAARAVAERLSAHFEKEEEFALPQLGLLVDLAADRPAPGMKPAIELSKRLKADLPQMLQEHKEVVAALEKLSAAAKEENKPEAVEFAHKLMAHAQSEEQVMYPAAILVGEYLKLKLK